MLHCTFKHRQCYIARLNTDNEGGKRNTFVSLFLKDYFFSKNRQNLKINVSFLLKQ